MWSKACVSCFFLLQCWVVKLTIGLVFVAGGLERRGQGGCGLYKVIMVFTLEGLQSR